jgi:hypothetical protein
MELALELHPLGIRQVRVHRARDIVDRDPVANRHDSLLNHLARLGRKDVRSE